MKNSLRLILFSFLIGVNVAYAQQNDFQTSKNNGIELYKQGSYRDAVNSLEKTVKFKEARTDAEVWNLLGLAYMEQSAVKDARKSIERAIKISPQNAAYRTNLAFAYLMDRKINKAQSEVEKAIAIDPNNAGAYYVSGTANFWENKPEKALQDAEKAIAADGKYSAAYKLKSDIFIRNFGNEWADEKPAAEYLKWLEQADAVLETCLKNCSRDQNFKSVADNKDSIQAYFKYFKKKSDQTNPLTPTSDDPNRTPMKIVFKPRARYTDNARQNGAQGTIHIAAVFSENGTLKNVLVLKGLGYGLDQQALEAASQIRFQPETENGKPVTVVRMLQYSFSIY